MPAAAQQPSRAHPADPRAVAPSPEYASAFDGYQPFRDEKLASWREVNDEAGRVGGHLGIFGGANAHAGHGVAQSVKTPTASAPAAGTSTPAAPPMKHGSGHQGMKK